MTIYAASLAGPNRNGLPEGRAYVYRGTKLDTADPIRALMRQPVQCGTWQGHNRHINNHEDSCDPCREAYKLYRRELRKAAVLRGKAT